MPSETEPADQTAHDILRAVDTPDARKLSRGLLHDHIELGYPVLVSAIKATGGRVCLRFDHSENEQAWFGLSGSGDLKLQWSTGTATSQGQEPALVKSMLGASDWDVTAVQRRDSPLDGEVEMASSTDEDREWPGLLICVPCEKYVRADEDAEETACEHSWDEARDVSHLSDEEWAKFRHDVHLKALHEDAGSGPTPEGLTRDLVSHGLASVLYDLAMADVLPDDYDEREGLERLLVTDP